MEFERDYNDFLSEGPAAVIDRFTKVSSYAYGKRVRVSNGREDVTGTTAGIGPEGLRLVKRDNGQVMRVIAGDVTEALEMLVTIDVGNTNTVLGEFRGEE